MQTTFHPITEETYLQLLQLRDKFSVYQTVNCRLIHEQVQELQEETITDDADLERLTVKRKGLCDSALRRNWLGCAHTSANHKFAKLADDMYDTGILRTTIRPSVEISDLVQKIYLTDIEKGMTDKKMALSQHQGNTSAVENLQEKLQDIIARHRALINELEQVRHNFMQQLDKAIESYQS